MDKKPLIQKIESLEVEVAELKKIIQDHNQPFFFFRFSVSNIINLSCSFCVNIF